MFAWLKQRLDMPSASERARAERDSETLSFILRAATEARALTARPSLLAHLDAIIEAASPLS